MEYKKLVISVPKENALIERRRLVKVKGTKLHMDPLVEERVEGIFKGSAFYLDSDFDWVLGKDSQNKVILVPLRK